MSEAKRAGDGPIKVELKAGELTPTAPVASQPNSHFVMDRTVVPNSDPRFLRQKKTGLISCVPARQREMPRSATEATRDNPGSLSWEGPGRVLKHWG